MEITTTTDFFGPAGQRMTIPTHVTPQGGQTTHPSVVYVPEGWNGFKYWMAHTPYPGGNDDHEDPNIVASNDGIRWVVPAGLTNPLDDQTGQPEYNSDVDLQLFEGTMYLFFRRFDPNKRGAEEQILMMTSEDGRFWTPPRVVYTADQTKRRLVSPSFLVHLEGWTMYAVDIVDPAANKLVRLRTSQRLPDPASWGEPSVCTMRLGTGRVPWHVSIIENPYGPGLVGLINDCVAGKSGSDGALYFMVSTNGINWSVATQTAVPKVVPGQHDASYRASLIPAIIDGLQGFRVYYAAWKTEQPYVWNVWRTFIDPHPLDDVYGTVPVPSVNPQSGTTVQIEFPPGRFRTKPFLTVNCDSARLNLSPKVLDESSAYVSIDNWTPARSAATCSLQWRASDRLES